MNTTVSKIAVLAILGLSLTPLYGDVSSDMATRLDDIESQLEGNEKSGFQLAGYASFGYTNVERGGDDFSLVQFSPIFHYQYSTIFQFEGELEINVDTDGETVVDLEYAAGNLYINDYMVLMVGKFMSPIGQFVQNLHPAWINKLPSKPLGFGHDGAAPSSNVGIALRGGLPKILNMRHNYALYIANAPTFEVAQDGDTIINTEGKTSSNGVDKTIGGRYGVNIVSGMEIGISGAIGKVAEIITAGTLIPGSGTSIDDTIQRDYSVIGADFMYHRDSFDFKGEYIRQEIGVSDASNLENGVWEAWYAQASYQFSSLPIEPVVRYSNYKNPEIYSDQVAVGLNYLFANNVIAKVAYEVNMAQNQVALDEGKENNRILAQLAFGF